MTPATTPVPAAAPRLPPRRARFVLEYLKDLNATQAAIRAGYSPRTARSQGSELLTFPDVQAAIQAGMADRAERVQLTADDIYRETKALAQSRLDHYEVDPESGDLRARPGAPADAMAAVSSVKRKAVLVSQGEGEPDKVVWEVEFRLWNKPETLRLASQHNRLIGGDGMGAGGLQVNVYALVQVGE
jgi:phage terminase small subunit